MFPINTQQVKKGIEQEGKNHTRAHIHTNTQQRPSLALVCELFAVIVDPGRSSNKSGQETNQSTQTAGHRPNLGEAG